MALDTADKQEIIEKYSRGEKDTGSTEIQVALLTARINGLKDHFKANIHDYHSNRGLLKMIGQRRSLLKYVKRKNSEGYNDFIKSLGLRK